MRSFSRLLFPTLASACVVGLLAGCNAQVGDNTNVQKHSPSPGSESSGNSPGSPDASKASGAEKQPPAQIAQAPRDEGEKQDAAAPDNLPQADPVFQGKIGSTYHDSQADKTMFASPTAPEGAPNILLVLIDDAGFGAPSTFGGPCNTPVLDNLAKGGLRFNRFHTTALCSPTRAALLTGHNHHSAATGVIMEMGTGFPGYTGIMPRSTATIGQILQNNGYSTAWIGKNHNVPSNMLNNVGPFSRWPNHLGFDYFYGFNGGEADQWFPTLYENLNPVQPWGTPEEGYNLGADQTDKAIAWMNNQKSIAPDRPFFLYYAPGATHAPHHPPKEWAAKYQGKFAHGYDKQREITFARQKELGVIPQDAKLTPRMKQLPSWDSHDDQAKKLFERQMEVYAGYYEYTDHQVGRILDAVDRIGQTENTLVIFIAGDNGASAEGSLVGTANEIMNLNGLDPTIEQSMKFYDEWGGPETSPHFAVGWAWAMDTPFVWNKQVASHFGGTRNPMVVSWPAKIKDQGGLRPQFHHVNDVAPTILEIVGVKQPSRFNGIKQRPMEGTSFVYALADDGASAPDQQKTQYFEMMGNRGIYHDGWMASVFHKVPWDTGGSVPFENDKCELYDLSKDYSQHDDLAAKNPDKLKELQAVFKTEGEKFGVFPLDDRLAGRLDVSLRPSWTSNRSKFTFFPGMTHLDEGTAPNVKNKSHSITAEIVIPEKGAEGVLLAMGGGTGGYVLYVKDNKFTYYYDFFGYNDYQVDSTALPTGKVTLRMDFKYDGGGPGKGGTVTLSVNGKKAGEGRVEKTIPARFGMDTFDVGMDLNAPVARGGIYKTPYKFTGTIDNVTIELKK
ncbi:MAG: arylsulfatase [Planctomycetales bacterium]